MLFVIKLDRRTGNEGFTFKISNNIEQDVSSTFLGVGSLLNFISLASQNSARRFVKRKIPFYTMPWKIQPIRIQESRCIVDGITSNLPIMRRANVALIVLTTVFPTAWYK